jgi:hypothetical protein
VRLVFPKRQALEFTSNRVRFYEREDISGVHEAISLPLPLFGQDRRSRFVARICVWILRLKSP